MTTPQTDAATFPEAITKDPVVPASVCIKLETDLITARQHAEDEIVAHNSTKARLAEWETAFETTNPAQAKAEHLAVLEKRKALQAQVTHLESNLDRAYAKLSIATDGKE